MILVTGATGRIGRAVVHSLIAEHDINPRVLVRDRGAAEAVLPEGVEYFEGDFQDPAGLEPALEGVGKALLLSPVHPRQVELQGNLLRTASAATHIVKISGLGTALDSHVQSGRWHAEIEAEIVQTGNPYTFLRPYFFMQNLAFQIDSARHTGVIKSGVGNARIAMVDVEDIAAVVAHILAGKTPMINERHALTGAEALNYLEIADLFSEVLERDVVYQPQDLDEIRENLLESGQPEWHVELLIQFNRAFIGGSASQVDGTVAQTLGRPPHSLRQFLNDNIDASGPKGGNPFPS